MSSLFSTLPMDLVPGMLENMTVEDVLSLKKSFGESSAYQGMRKQCNNRLSAVSYLDKQLGCGNEWLTALSESNGYMSGSMSLNFFVPGSTVSSSDCDVYVSEYEDMERFIDHGSKLNIKWLNNAEMVKLQLQKGKTTVRMSAHEFRNIHESGLLYEVLGTEFEPTYHRVPRYWRESVELVFNEGKVSVRPIYNRGWYGTQGILDMKYGEISRNGSTVPVQLIVQNNREISMFSSVFRFHSTCVQSFIGPYMACHLYGKEAAMKRSHCWIDNVKKRVSEIHFPSCPNPTPLGSIGHLAPEWKKYEDRGFSYFSLAVYVGYQNRQIGDNQCTTLDYSGPMNASPSEAEAYQSKVMRVKWAQYNNKRPSIHPGEVAKRTRRYLHTDFLSTTQQLTV